jgi:hypothetical protein
VQFAALIHLFRSLAWANMVFYWYLPEGVPAAQIAKFQSLVETDSRKIDGIRVFFAFLCEKAIKTRRFSHLQPYGCSGVRPGAPGTAKSKNFVDQCLDARCFT